MHGVPRARVPRAVAEGRSLALGAAKQRALLAVLVLNDNRIVSTDRLIDALWGEEAADGAAHTVQVYVSALRKALGSRVRRRRRRSSSRRGRATSCASSRRRSISTGSSGS